MKSKKDSRDKPQNIYRIPYKYGRECTGEKNRPLGIRIKEYRQVYFNRLKLAAHVFEQGRKIDGHQQIFYSLNPIILIKNSKKQLILYIWINPIFSPVQMYHLCCHH